MGSLCFTAISLDFKVLCGKILNNSPSWSLMSRRLAYQFKITLKDIKPSIWRRIQVSDLYSFWDLHVAIQDAMGGLDYHLHQFITNNPKTGEEERIGIPEAVYSHSITPGETETLPGRHLKIRDYFNMENRFMGYEYDFGDGWEHIIEFEGAVAKDEKARYPRCVGGIHGFEIYLEAISNTNHKEHASYLEWRGPYAPKAFDYKKVRFDNPSQRWKKAFMED